MTSKRRRETAMASEPDLIEADFVIVGAGQPPA
jgi:hypothetical protein